MNRVADAWNAFFFTPSPPHTLALFRIAFGLVVFLSVLGVYPHRDVFYGPDAIVLPEVMGSFFAGHWLILGFNFLPSDDPGLALFLLGLMAAALCLMVGLASRLSSVLVLVGLYSLNRRNFFITNAGDLLMRIDALVLVFAPSGAAFSVDRLLRKQKDEPPAISPWPVRLLQLQLAYLYLTTSLLKLQGASWREGTALYYALRYLELQRFSFRYCFYYLWQIKLASWLTVGAEAAMGTLVWFRRLRYPCLVAASGLHLGINLAMQFPVFQYVMLANLILFICPQDIRAWIQKPGGTIPPPPP